MPLILLLLIFQREGAEAGILKSIDGQPAKADYYNWNYTSGSWQYSGEVKFEYDNENKLILEIAVNNSGDTTSKKTYSYNNAGKETEALTYAYTNNAFVLTRKELRTYDSKGNLSSFVKSYSFDGVQWRNEEKTVFYYSLVKLEYPDIVEKYHWETNDWKLFNKYTNVVWTDFVRERFSAGVVEEYSIGSTRRITYTTDDNGIKKGRSETYNNSTNSWTYSLDEIHTKDIQGNTIMTVQGDYGSGPILFSRITYTVDVKGNDTGYLAEVWSANKWKFISSELTTNNYNSNGALIETFTEGKEIGSSEVQSTGINYKTKVVYEGNSEVTSLGQSSAFPMIQMSYPNPCKNILNIEDVSKEDMEVSLFDLNNHPVLSSSISQGKGNIVIEDIPSGLYLLKATSQSGAIYFQKIVKE